MVITSNFSPPHLWSTKKSYREQTKERQQQQQVMASLTSDVVDPYWCDRLTNYYKKYNPDKVSTVSATLSKYKGYEMKLFQKLIEKYGPEPEPAEEVEEKAKKNNTAEQGSGAQSDDDDDDDDDDADDSEEDESEEDETDLGSLANMDSSDWPVTVPFCPNCGLPFEYCEYSMTARFGDCIPHMLESRPNMMLQKKEMTVQTFCEESSSASDGKKNGGKEPQGETKEPPIDPNDPRAAKKAEKRERKRIANDRKAKNKKKAGNHGGPTVNVTIKNRTKRKFIVNIFGMDKFGVKLKDAGKKLSKKYACSATVSKNAMNQKEIVMSGNIGYDIADVIHSLYDNIPIASIVVEMKKKKKKEDKQVIAPQ